MFVGKEAPQPQPIVIDLAEDEDFECPADGMFADQENGCESYYVCHSDKVNINPILYMWYSSNLIIEIKQSNQNLT